MKVFSALLWVRRAWVIMALSVWGVFLPVGGALSLLNGTYLWAALFGLGGLLLTWQVLDLVTRTHWRRGLLIGLALYHALLALIGGVAATVWPMGGQWTQLPETSSWSDPTLLRLRSGTLVAVVSDPKESFWSDDGGTSWRARKRPGHYGFALAEDTRRNWLWVGPARGNHLNAFSEQRGWLQLPHPGGHVWAVAATGDRVFVALGHAGLFWTDDAATRWSHLGRLNRCYSVTAASDNPRHLLAVGDRWIESRDAGQTWREVGQAIWRKLRRPTAAIGGGGWRYVIANRAGLLGLVRRGRIAVGHGDGAFELRRLPARDVRVLVADPIDGRRVYVGTWGAGVFASTDAGRSWKSLGLRSIETRSMALDVVRKRLYVGSANLLLRRGVYVTDLQ